MRHSPATTLARRSSSEGSFGRQRLHGLNPARSASAAVAWNSTFSHLGLRAAQEGRQYTPVVLTE